MTRQRIITAPNSDGDKSDIVVVLLGISLIIVLNINLHNSNHKHHLDHT